MAIIRSVSDTLFDTKSRMVFHNKNHNFKAGADYFINKMNTIGVMVNGNFSEPEFNNTGRTAIAYQPTKTVDRILIADNKSFLKRDNINYNLN